MPGDSNVPMTTAVAELANQFWTADWATLLLAVVGLSLIMLMLFYVYRSMQRPRLRTVVEANGKPGVRWQAVVRYLVTMPFMVVWWYLVILLIVAAASNSRTPEQIAVLSAGVVGGARVLAHIHTDASEELGKTVPLAVL